MLSLALLIVSPHSQDANRALLLEDFVDQSVLDADAAGIGRPLKITYKLFKWRWISKGIIRQYAQQLLSIVSESRRGELLGILERLLGIGKLPTHHFTARALFSRGSAMPFLIDSRMPGTESKYRVS